MEEEVRGPRRRRAAFGRDWTKGSIMGNLLSLAWPIILSDVAKMIGPTLDMVWVGRLGVASIAAVGVGAVAILFLTAVKMGLNWGARAMIARFIGAGDEKMANRIAQQAFIISTVYAIVVIVIGLAFAEQILALMGLEADVIREGAPYIRIMFVNQAFMGVWMLAEVIMQASGDTVNPMKITVFARFVHVALCPFLVFGWWLFPCLGTTGAAVANLAGFSLAVLIGAWFLFTGRSRLRPTLRGFRVDPVIIWRLVKIGLPAVFMSIERSFGRVVLMRFIAPFGTVAFAAFSVSERVDHFLFMPAMALGVAAGVLVGQNLGAGQPGRAERGGWLAAGVAEAILVTAGSAILLWAEGIIRIFNPDPGLVEIGALFLRIQTAGYLVMGLSSTLQQGIAGAGDTLPPMLFTLIISWGVQIPLAWFLPRLTTLGFYGISWAVAISTIVGAVIYVTYFKLGRWKRKKV